MCNGTDANMGVRACVDIINIFIYHCILYTMAHYLYIYIYRKIYKYVSRVLFLYIPYCLYHVYIS